MRRTKQAEQNKVKNLEEKTGKSIDEWISLANNSGYEKHGEILSYLKNTFGIGHGYANLVVHYAKQSHAGAVANTDDLVVLQYKGKENLQPWYDKLVKEIKSDVKADPNNPVSASGNLDLYHFDNFIKSIRGESKLTAPVNEGHKSVLLCHLANIAQRTGTTLHCDPSNGHILNNKEASKLWRREYAKGWEPKV